MIKTNSTSCETRTDPFMKQYVFFIVTITLLSIQQTIADASKIDEWGIVTNNIQMSIMLKDKAHEIHTNQAVIMVIRFKNTSTNESFIMYWMQSIKGDPSISFTITTPSGKDISPKIDSNPTGSAYFRRITPNEIVDMEIDMSRRCKFDEVGKYKITARRPLESVSDRKPFVVVSNPLYVLVTPGAGSEP